MLGWDEFGDLYQAKSLVWDFQSLNPHAIISLNDSEAIRRCDSLKKWTPDMPTSPHWYSSERFRNLVTHFVREQDKMTIRDFAGTFRGLSRTSIRKELLERTGLTGKAMSDLIIDGRPNAERIDALLETMKALSAEVEPKHLGGVGKEYVLEWMRDFDIVEESFKYKQLSFQTTNGIPYLIELAFAVMEDEDVRLNVTCGINHTPMLTVPVRELYDLLSECRVDHGDQCLVWMHILTPAPMFTDAGKTNLFLPQGSGLDKAVQAVTDFLLHRRVDDERLESLDRDGLDRYRDPQGDMHQVFHAVLTDGLTKAADLAGITRLAVLIVAVIAATEVLIGHAL